MKYNEEEKNVMNDGLRSICRAITFCIFLTAVVSCSSMIDDSSDRISIMPDAERPGIPVYSISGHITNLKEGVQFIIKIEGAGQSVLSSCDSEGEYVFTNVPAGNYTLTPSGGGLLFYPEKIDIAVVSDNVSVNNFRAYAKYWEISSDSSKETGLNSIVSCDDGFVSAGYVATPGKGKDICITRWNPAGGIVWEKIFGGDYDDQAIVIRKGGDGLFVLCGSVGSVSASSGLDMRIVKISFQGIILYSTVFGGVSIDEGKDILPLDNGSVVVLGNSRSYSEYGDNDIVLFGVDAGGNVVLNNGKPWLFGDSSDETAAGIVFADSGYLIVYNSRDSATLLNQVSVKRLESDYSVSWSRILYSPYHDFVRSVALSSSGVLFAGGYTCDTVSDKRSFLAMKISAGGELLQRKKFEDPGTSECFNVFNISDDSIIYSGFTSRISGLRDKDYLHVYVNSELSPFDRISSGSSFDDTALGICQAPETGFYSIISVLDNGVCQYRIRKTDGRLIDE